MKIIKRIIAGAKDHPGNVWYVLFLVIFLLPGIEKNNWTLILLGLGVYAIIFVPLYLVTAYQGGKANEKKP